MGRAQRQLDSLRRVSQRKKKSQIARALWPGSDGIVQPGCDRQFGDPRYRPGGILSRNAFQNPAFWNGEHHDAGGNSFAWRIPSGEFQRETNKQLFEPDQFICSIKRKSQGPSTEPADRPGRDFQWPHPLVVDPKLSVDRSEEHTSELQSRLHLVCRLLLEKKKKSSANDSSTRSCVLSTRMTHVP